MNYELRNQKGTSRPRHVFFHNSCFIIPNSNKKGFSLVELMVSIAIFTLLISVIMVSQRRFGGQILISNLAYDIALGVRQAQVYGISVKASSGGSGGPFSAKAYGIHFNINKPQNYILFADLDNDGMYDVSDNGNGCNSGGECVSFFRIQQGNTISLVCVRNGAGVNDCTPTTISGTDITFKRPEPEPVVKGLDTNGNPNGAAYSSAAVSILSPQGLARTITILQSGQVTVTNN